MRLGGKPKEVGQCSYRVAKQLRPGFPLKLIHTLSPQAIVQSRPCRARLYAMIAEPRPRSSLWRVRQTCGAGAADDNIPHMLDGLKRPSKLERGAAACFTHPPTPSEAVKGHQWPSDANRRGHQRPSEAIRGHPRPSEVIRGHQRPSQAVTGRHRPSQAIGHQGPPDRPSKAIRGHQRSLEAIRGHQGPSEAFTGCRRLSEAIRGHRPSGAIRGHRRPSEAVRGCQRPSEAISHQRPSEAMEGHQMPSDATRGHQRPSEVIRGH